MLQLTSHCIFKYCYFNYLIIYITYNY
jgi:hypothetical protein